jgi:phage baseplate assembly protein V
MNRQLMDFLNRALAPLRRRVDNMVARALVRLVNDGTAKQELQLELLGDEVRDHCERFQQYGFTCVPLPGAQAVVVFVGGNRDHPLVTNVDDKRHRPTDMGAGEVKLYDCLGKFIYLREDGVLEINAPKIQLVASEWIRAQAAEEIDIDSAQDLRLYAGQRYRRDVHGFADELRYVSGTTWQPETWQDTATVNADPTNPIEVPEVAPWP